MTKLKAHHTYDDEDPSRIIIQHSPSIGCVDRSGGEGKREQPRRAQPVGVGALAEWRPDSRRLSARRYLPAL